MSILMANPAPPRKLHLLHVHASSAVGGTELSTLELLSGLDSGRFSHTSAFLDRPGPISATYQGHGVETVFLRKDARTGGMVAFFRLVQFLRGRRFDAMLLYGIASNLLGRAASILGPSVPVIGIIRGLSNTERTPRLRIFLDRLTMPLVDVYISNSRRVAEALIARGFPRRKIQVCPTGIDPRPFLEAPPKDQARALLDLPQGGLIATCVANLRPVKDHPLLFDACARLWRQGMEFLLLLAGGGPEEKELRARAVREGYEGRIRFLGLVKEIPAVLAASDVFVLASHSEGLPRSLMEAMAAGLPVVATDVGGVCELMVHEETGLLVPKGDSGGFARAIGRLLNDAGQRRSMGRAGQKRIEEAFHIRIAARRFETLIEAAVAARPSI